MIFSTGGPTGGGNGRSPKRWIAQNPAGTGLTQLEIRCRRHRLMPGSGSAASRKVGRADVLPAPSSADPPLGRLPETATCGLSAVSASAAPQPADPPEERPPSPSSTPSEPTPKKKKRKKMRRGGPKARDIRARHR